MSYHRPSRVLSFLASLTNRGTPINFGDNAAVRRFRAEMASDDVPDDRFPGTMYPSLAVSSVEFWLIPVDTWPTRRATLAEFGVS